MRLVTLIALSSLVVLSSVTPAGAGVNTATRLSAGAYHTCAVTSAGGVRCWGRNDHGQLGDGTTTDRPTPFDVPGLTSGIAAVDANGDWRYGFTCAVTTAGGVKCWGYNADGELGDGTTTERHSPVDVSGLASGVASVAAGYMHACAVTTGGGVKCWGNNTFGQLGDGTTTTRLTPVDASGLTSGVAAVAVGMSFTCVLTTGGGLKCWGRNYDGQVGDGTTSVHWTPVDVLGLTSGVTAVTAGEDYTCALTTMGAVKCWGNNSYGQVGDGSTTDRWTPVNVSGLTSGVAAVAAGASHACAVTTGGGLKCWGVNGSGELGDGTPGSRSTPVDVSGLAAGVTAVTAGEDHTCALTTGGGVRCWGDNYYGQIGNGGTSSARTPVDVLGLMGAVATVAAGDRHACALTTGGGVKCWGDNANGALGDGTTSGRSTAADVPGLTSGVAAVAAGGAHTCALTTAGGVKCWGFNGEGGLGDGTTTSRSAPVDVSGLTSGAGALATGGYHSCAVTAVGGVKCWGRNFEGELGDGTRIARSTPIDVLGLASGVSAVAAGGYHTCALTTGGGLKCWGRNDVGQLGDGTTTERWTPADVPGLTSGVTAVAAGGGHTCAVTTTGGVKCWGDNYWGDLGDGTMTTRTTPVDVSGLTSGVAAIGLGFGHACALTTGGGVKCWGDNNSGDLGDGTTTSRYTPVDVSGLTSGVVAVATGSCYSCAVTTGGAVKCWGESSRVGNPRYAQWHYVPTRTLTFGRADFDADDKVDVAVYRPSSGTWFSLDSSAGNTAYRYNGWGVQAQNDTPIVGDFDGDGTLDPAVFRPATGTWFILRSSANYTAWSYFGWGGATDILVPGDYDGDGVTDAAVYRPSEGKWYVRPSSGGTAWTLSFGNATDTPIAGDFDGDGKRDPAVYRASTGTWFWLKSSTNFTTFDYKGWGVDAQGDTPAPGDYDGDGKTDPCVFRPASGTWFILESHTNYTTMSYFGWGTTGDTLVPADYDADGRTDGAIYRAATGTWYVRPSSGATPWSKIFGNATDVPLVTIR